MGRGRLGSTLSDADTETVSQQEVDLLRSRLEASEMKHRVKELEQVVDALQKELKESNALLLKSRKLCARPHLSSIEKQRVAARQHWLCNAENCPLRVLTPNGTFSESLFFIDHRVPWSRCARHSSNLQALCVHCDSVKLRNEIATRQHRRPDPPASSDEEADGERDEDEEV